MRDVIRDKYPKTVLGNEIIKNVNIIARSSRNALLLKEPDAVAKEVETVKQSSAKSEAAFTKLDSLVSDPKGRELVDVILTARKAYNASRDEVMRLALAGAKDEAVVALIKDLRPLQMRYFTSIEALIDFETQLMLTAADNAEESYKAARLMVFVLSGFGIFFASFVGYWVTRSITVPLSQAVEVAETVAAGNLTSQFDTSSKDETGQLLRALRAMNDNLHNIVSEVRIGTDSIESNSAQIARGNLDLSNRTEEQASSLEQTATSMEQLTATVKQNADNARQANDYAVSACAVAVEGGSVVDEVVGTMAAINDSAKKIVDIISVIDGIAFQTNILALNAAVEAARAGEQGRGFAVVASEVRTLAQRSASAAKEIKSLINDSVEKVDFGSSLVEKAGHTMHEIVVSVKRVTDVVSEISSASHEQSSGIEKINVAISQMDETTQQNAALVEQAAAAAQSLQDQANKLSRIVSVFNIGQPQHVQQVANTTNTSPSKSRVSTKSVKTAGAKSAHAVPEKNISPTPQGLKNNASAPRLPVTAGGKEGDDWEQF